MKRSKTGDIFNAFGKDFSSLWSSYCWCIVSWLQANNEFRSKEDLPLVFIVWHFTFSNQLQSGFVSGFYLRVLCLMSSGWLNEKEVKWENPYRVLSPIDQSGAKMIVAWLPRIFPRAHLGLVTRCCFVHNLIPCVVHDKLVQFFNVITLILVLW